MKIQQLSLLASAVAFLFVAGCSKTEESAPAAASPAESPKPPTPAAAVQHATDTAAAAADKANATAKEAQTAVQSAATDAQAQAAALTSKTQSLIDSAKKLLADGNWSEALKSLTDLSAMKLTPDQQSMVDQLKAQAQKLAEQAATSKATEQGAKAVNDLLKKK